MSIFFVKWGSGRYTMSVVTPTFIIEPKKNSSCKLHELFYGDPVGIRTLDLLIRSQSLYPAELPSHILTTYIV